MVQHVQSNGVVTDHVWFVQVGDVRNCCLKTLAPLHETQDLSLKLELFTNRFKVSWDVGHGERGSDCVYVCLYACVGYVRVLSLIVVCVCVGGLLCTDRCVVSLW